MFVDHIINAAIQSIDEPDSDRGITGYTSKKIVEVVYGDRGKFCQVSKGSSCLRCMGRDDQYSDGIVQCWGEKHYLIVTGSLHLLTARASPYHTRNNDSESRKG